jgi:hypothetical protein
VTRNQRGKPAASNSEDKLRKAFGASRVAYQEEDGGRSKGWPLRTEEMGGVEKGCDDSAVRRLLVCQPTSPIRARLNSSHVAGSGTLTAVGPVFAIKRAASATLVTGMARLVEKAPNVETPSSTICHWKL